MTATATQDVTVLPEPLKLPPEVHLVFPSDGALYEVGVDPLPTQLVATATDPDSPVATVEFFLDGVSIGQGISHGSDTWSLPVNPDLFLLPPGQDAQTVSLTARASDPGGLSTTSTPATITLYHDTGAPDVEITSPADSSEMTCPTDIIGTAFSPILETYEVQYRYVTPNGDRAWLVLHHASAPIQNATLATFDPTLLLNGIYELRLIATDRKDRTSASGTVTIVVRGDMKIGHFALAFEDLKLPLSGIPIQVVRSYDSRDREPGDFGPGWHVAIHNVRLQKNRSLAHHWQDQENGGNVICPFSMADLREHLVTITLPDNKTYRFQARAINKNMVNQIPSRQNCFLSFDLNPILLRFDPIGNTYAILELDGDPEAFYVPGDGFYQDDLLTPFNPTRFVLTLDDGTRFLIDELLGLLSMTDLNGNSLAVSETSITSTQQTPAGPKNAAITIQRHPDGRIHTIADAAGGELHYTYDDQNRLSTFTNRVGDVTTFLYENAQFPTYLTKILDPRGLQAIRTEYGPDGRVAKQTDAAGRDIIFNRGLDPIQGRFESVTDRLGHETTYYYNNLGQVLTKIDPEGAQTT